MEREALHSAAVKFSLDLHPSATGDVMEGVRDQLNTSLLRPSVYLDGVLVSYTNPCILSKQARIHPYFPYFHVDVSADCVLFKPAVGQILDGKVHMVSHDFIGLLILGLFNVSIGRQQIRADLNYDVLEDCWKSQRHAEHRIARDTALRFRVEKIDDESEFFTMAGSLLAAGTGSIAFIGQQARAKSKKRRRSEAAATDASPSQAPAAIAQAPANLDPAPDGLSAKARKKAAKQLSRASVSGSARATALVGAGTAPTVPAQNQVDTAPDSTTRSLHNQEVAGGNTDALSPKKKKRQKHHDQPTPAPATTAIPGQLPVNVQSNAQQASSAPANGIAAPLPRAVTHRPAAGGAPVRSQATAPSTQKLPEPQGGVPQAKQKSHKRKKREIDKPVMATTTPSGQSSGVSQEQTQIEKTLDAEMNGNVKKKKKKRKKEKGSTGEDKM